MDSEEKGLISTTSTDLQEFDTLSRTRYNPQTQLKVECSSLGQLARLPQGILH